MSKTRIMAMVGGTVVGALAIGFFMQNGQSDARPVAGLAPIPVSQTVLDAPAPLSVEPEALPQIPAQADGEAALRPLRLENVMLTSALPPLSVPRALPPLYQEAALSGDVSPLPATPTDPAVPQLGCPVIAKAEPIERAQVHLSVSAPCYGNERLTIHHNGMMFTAVTDDSGSLGVDVPVLAEKAIFILAFANGKGAVAQADVPALAGYDRVALQWSGREGFQIHAREFGASYNDAGHIWSGRVQDAGDASQPHGFVTRLGDVDTLAPRIVEIYSFPRAASGRSGTVAMTVEAEVTTANCGRDVTAETLELTGNGGLRTRDLVMSVPDCSAVGDFLVLNNLVNDLKIAGN